VRKDARIRGYFAKPKGNRGQKKVWETAIFDECHVFHVAIIVKKNFALIRSSKHKITDAAHRMFTLNFLSLPLTENILHPITVSSSLPTPHNASSLPFPKSKSGRCLGIMKKVTLV
jgi:hypothetical protein